MSEQNSPMQDVVTGIINDYVGKYLSKKDAPELVGRIVKAVLMTREGTSLPNEPGVATAASANEKSGHLSAEPEHLDTPKKNSKVVAIVSMPYDDPRKSPDDQPGSMPFTIEHPR